MLIRFISFSYHKGHFSLHRIVSVSFSVDLRFSDSEDSYGKIPIPRTDRKMSVLSSFNKTAVEVQIHFLLVAWPLVPDDMLELPVRF